MRLTARLVALALVFAGGFGWAAISAEVGQKQVVAITLKGGKVHGQTEMSGGLPVVRVRRGQEVVLRWRSDIDMIVHLHGYDIETRVKPDHEAMTEFVARAAGRFPVERHAKFGHTTLLYLEVRP
ncbi:MAG: hypothetical protein FJ145_17505 [Deltaproteobacteria bacterium]|nr:hypothetical protein [Deltaproteobacteria bacterium]